MTRAKPVFTLAAVILVLAGWTLTRRPTTSRAPFVLMREGADVHGSAAVARLFDLVDRDHDGKISKAELDRLSAWRSVEPIDLDGDGTIDRDEFAASFLSVSVRGQLGEQLVTLEQLRECRQLLDAGLVEQAAAQCRSLVDQSPDMPQVWSLWARILDARGRSPEARAALTRALRISGGNVDARITWANFSVEHDSPEEARAALGELLSAMKAQLEKIGDSPDLEHQRRVDQEAAADIAGLYLQKFRDPGETSRFLEEARKQLGDSPWMAGLDLSLQTMAGRSDSALEKARLLPASFRSAFEVLIFEAQTAQRQGHRREAEELYRKAMSSPTAQPGQRLLAASNLYVSLSRWVRTTEAQDVLRQEILPLTTTLTQARHLARCLSELGFGSQALEQLEPLVGAERGAPEHLVAVALLRGERGDEAGRRAALRQALERCDATRAGVAGEIRSMLGR